MRSAEGGPPARVLIVAIPAAHPPSVIAKSSSVLLKVSMLFCPPFTDRPPVIVALPELDFLVCKKAIYLLERESDIAESYAGAGVAVAGLIAALPQPPAPGRSPIGQGKATLAAIGTHGISNTLRQDLQDNGTLSILDS